MDDTHKDSRMEKLHHHGVEGGYYLNKNFRSDDPFSKEKDILSNHSSQKSN